MRRRDALRAGGLALAATAIAPAVARAEPDEGGLLLGLWRREMGAAFAYAEVLHVDPLFATLRSHAADHAAALATQLAAVGLGTPPPPKDVAGLDIAAARVATAEPRAALHAALLLEEDFVEVYKTALPALPDAKIAMTAATILGSHSQHVLILELHIGKNPLATV